MSNIGLNVRVINTWCGSDLSGWLCNKDSGFPPDHPVQNSDNEGDSGLFKFINIAPIP